MADESGSIAYGYRCTGHHLMATGDQMDRVATLSRKLSAAVPVITNLYTADSPDESSPLQVFNANSYNVLLRKQVG